MNKESSPARSVWPLHPNEWAYLLVLAGLLVVVLAVNVFIGSSISSPQNLAVDLASPPESPQLWQVQDWAVVKYRALFKLIVHGTWSQFFAADDALSFFRIYVGWSWLFFTGALAALYFYLRLLEFDARTSFIGGLFFLGSPPVLLAYRYPVYTREDCLAYLLLLLGLIAAFRNRAFWAGVFAFAATLTRETTMILPVAYFLASGAPWIKRGYVVGMSLLAFVGIRVVWGFVVGNSFESSILNWQFPFETAAFLFCVFGVLWLPYLSGLYRHWRAGDYASRAWQILGQSGPVVLALVLFTTLTIARAREIRITFILFPWAIPFALDWFRAHGADLCARVGSPGFWAVAVAILATLSAGVLLLHLTLPDAMRSYLADFKNGYWLGLGTLHLSATVALFWPWRRALPNGQST